jgi:hypothetical protein
MLHNIVKREYGGQHIKARIWGSDVGWQNERLLLRSKDFKD